MRYLFVHLVPYGNKLSGTSIRSLERRRCITSSSVTPKVHFRGRTIAARPNEKLRDVLLRADRDYFSPHNGGARLINCRGLGSCGTCAVQISQGSVDPPIRSAIENFRLSLPPHGKESSSEKNMRLACQVRVTSDISLRKFDKFWGEGEEEQKYD